MMGRGQKTPVFAIMNLKMILNTVIALNLKTTFILQFQLIVNGQTGLNGDHVLKAVMVEPKYLQDPKLYRKVMVELVQAQVKTLGLVIANHALVRFHLHNLHLHTRGDGFKSKLVFFFFPCRLSIWL